MADVITITVQDVVDEVGITVIGEEIVTLTVQEVGMRGPEGPEGPPGSGATLSSDADQSLTIGFDGGIYYQDPNASFAALDPLP